MLAELLAHERNRFRIERHRYRLARFRLVGMLPRQSPCQINLCPLQTGDVERRNPVASENAAMSAR